MSRLPLLLLLLSAAACSGLRRADGAREVVVEAEGWAPAAGTSLLSSKRRALADAQKKAVEKAVGVTVSARTKVDDAISVRQSIEANLGGTIRRYEVLSERAEGAFYKVLIRAAVLHRPRDPGRRLKAVSFSVRLPQEKAASALRATLLSYDYPLGESDAEAAVLVSGVVETAGRSDLRLGGFHSSRARLTLSVADRRDGSTAEKTCEGAALDLDERAAQDAALEEAAGRCGQELARMFSEPEARVTRSY